MAQNISNILSPAQQALTNKLTNPFGSMAVSTPATKTAPLQPTSNMSTPSGPALGGVGAVQTPAPARFYPTPTGALPPAALPPTAPAPQTPTITAGTNQPAPPITGNFQTPSGATVNATTGGLVTPPPTYQGLVGNLATTAQQGSTGTQNAIGGLTTIANTNPLTSGQGYANYNNAVHNLQDIKNQEAATTQAIADTPIEYTFQQGRQGQAQQYYAAKEAAAQQAVNQEQTALGYGIQEQGQQAGALNQAGGLANTQQQLTQSGLTSAAGFAQPQLGAIGSQQYYNPLTAGASGGGTLPPDAMTAIDNYAQQIKNGQITRADAEGRLSAYGITGLNALAQALGPTFNTNASNASAATTGVGQQIQAAITPANQALDSLQAAYNSLSGLQQGSAGIANIPILSGLVQNASLNFGPGRDAASAYQGALQEARSRIDAALVGSIGVNAAAAQASALLPDNMLPAEIPQKIAAAKQYLQNQLAGYSQSGQQPASTTSSGNTNSLYNF